MLEKVKNNSIIKKLGWFFESYYYPVFVFAVVLFTHFFALDILGFIITISCFCLALILCDDTRHVLPFVLMFPYVVSTQNSPGYGHSEYYGNKTNLAIIITLAVLIILAITVRVVARKEYKLFFNNKKLLLGVLILVPSFLFAGIFSGKIDINSIIVSAVMIVLLPIFYLVFSSSIHSKNDNMLYLARCAVLALILMSLEILFVYLLKYKAGTPLDSNWKCLIIVGSVVSNSASEFIVILLPFCFYLAYREKYGFIYYIIASLSLIPVYLTLSRASLLFFVPTFLFGSMFLCFKGRYKNFFRISFIAFCLAIALFLFYIFKFNYADGFFEFFKNTGFDSRGRTTLWKYWIDEFKSKPIFGVGFSSYMQSNAEIDHIFKGLAHNTLIQFIGSAGIVGTALFLFHLFELFKFFIKNFNANTLILGISLLLLLGISLVDQIFFFPNFIVIYTMLLIIAEKETSL